MNRFVLKNTFIKVYIYHFLINIFIETRSQSCILEILSLSKMTFFTNTERVYIFFKKDKSCKIIFETTAPFALWK